MAATPKRRLQDPVVHTSPSLLRLRVPALLAGLTHPDFLQRDRCAEALIRIGSWCLPSLRQAMAQGGVMVGGEAVPLTINVRMTYCGLSNA